MASPIGHVLVGVGLATVVVRAAGASPSPALWLGAAIASGAPDLDLLGLGFGFGLDRVHRRATHSLVVLGALVLVSVWLWKGPMSAPASIAPGHILAWSVALLSHPIIDVLTTGPETARAGFGIPLFWPVVSRRWSVRRPLVRSFSITRSIASGQLWRALLPEICFFGSASVTLIVLSCLL